MALGELGLGGGRLSTEDLERKLTSCHVRESRCDHCEDACKVPRNPPSQRKLAQGWAFSSPTVGRQTCTDLRDCLYKQHLSAALLKPSGVTLERIPGIMKIQFSTYCVWSGQVHVWVSFLAIPQDSIPEVLGRRLEGRGRCSGASCFTPRGAGHRAGVER